MTLADKMRAVKSDERLLELYHAELVARKIRYEGRNKMKVNGKKVGIQTFENAQKYAAGYVYDNHRL